MQVTARTSPTSAVVGVEATVRVAGRADLPAVAETETTIGTLLAAGVRHLVVDVSAAREVSPDLLTVLARADARLNGGAGRAPAGGSFRLVGVALPEFLVALQDAALDEVFVVYDALRTQPPRIPAPQVRT